MASTICEISHEFQENCSKADLYIFGFIVWSGGEKKTPYLVGGQQQSKASPEAGTVQHQGRTKVSTQTILADPRDIIRLRLLLQSTLYHVPTQKALRRN